MVKQPELSIETFAGQLYNNRNEVAAMKHEVTTLQTKKMLAASLKKFMEKKSLSKITVSEIIADCGVNRKTFYYHFHDIYALLKWMLEQEAVEVLKQFDLIGNTAEAVSFVMDYAQANQHIINCAYDAMGRDEMKRFFYTDFIDVLRAAIDAAEEEIGLSVDEDFKAFLAEFYTEALTGILIQWLKDPNADAREKVLQYTTMVCRVSISRLLHARAEELASSSQGS